MKRIIAVVVTLVMLFMLAPQNVYAAEKITPSGISYDDIKKEIDCYMDNYQSGLASVGTSVFDASGSIYTGYYGYSDMENKVPADEQTVYEWGSVSKLLVWVSVMQLKEQGKLDMEADIRKYLPEGFLTKLQYEEETISMLNLMNHDAGFQESVYENQTAAEDELFDCLEDAVKACECYQAYHVGEHTAYSNWGTALAALIVEKVSGMSYVDYVHQNIFEPLGMKHTSVGMHMEDNSWVREQREELKCYARYEQEAYNEDYGVCHTWVQLYPAGSVIGTTSDLAKFAQGFVATECPFFESNDTRDEMFSASSYYGDSEIVKNCHGLWTAQFKVQTLGHGGNTGGCTANLQFDPNSKLGAVVLTNEPGETMYSTGIMSLLFGDIMESELVENNPVTDQLDISGTYSPTRTIVKGFGSATRYAGGFFFVKHTDNPKVFDMPLTGGLQIIHIGNKMWLQKSESGMSQFLYESMDDDGNLQFEMMSTDYIRSSSNICGTVAYLGYAFFGVICIFILLVKGVAFLVRKVVRRRKTITRAEKQITLQQGIQGMSSVILFCLISVIGARGYGFAVFSCIMASLLTIISFVNGLFLFRVTGDSPELKKATKVKQYIWAVLCFGYVAVTIWLQLYDFIHI